MHSTELYQCNVNCEAVIHNDSQKHISSFQRTVKLSISKYNKALCPSLGTLRRAYEMPCRATQATGDPAPLSASNTGNWRNRLGRAGLQFPSAPKHPQWLPQECKMEDLLTCFIRPLWRYCPCSYLIPFAYHHSDNNRRVETPKEWK